jgi:hypothetical protein
VHVRRTALHSIRSEALPLPPVPLRVMPGPLPGSDESAQEKRNHPLPSPPVPSKIPPGPISENVHDNAAALDDADTADPK